MTFNRNSEDCLRLFGVNIVAKKPVTAADAEKDLNGAKSCKDEYFSQEFDQQLHAYHGNNNMGTLFIPFNYINNTLHMFSKLMLIVL